MLKLGILGGMGPLATADFFTKIINNTDVDSDKEHIPVLIDSNTQIPDRTSFILNKEASLDDPLVEMINSALILQRSGADYLAMPCNTAHFFYDEIVERIDIPFVNMIEATACYIKDNYRSAEKVLLLATQGTYKSDVYKKIFTKYGLEVEYPSLLNQDNLMNLIYQVKAAVDSVDRIQFKTLMEELEGYIDTPIILGCTELPLLIDHMNVERPFVDPTLILAKKCVRISKGVDKLY